MAKPVTTVREDYARYLPQWKLAQDAAKGSAAVKAAREAYLPKPNPTDTSKENAARYDHYVTRAMYYNATGRTLSGFCGIAFARDPVLTLPATIESIKEDATGAGKGLLQHAKQTLRQVLTTGRAGLLVDFPTVESPVSRLQQSSGVQPRLVAYEAKDIINWRTAQIDGKTHLTLVVLQESYLAEDGFGTSAKGQYRVLRLESEVYSVELWRQAETSVGVLEWVIAQQFTPKQGNGQAWTEIPFAFVGAEDNDADIDESPMFDIAVVNIAHYRNSADYEDSCYLVGQPQFYIAGLTEEWRDSLIDKGIYLGSRTVVPLPVGGSMGIVQAEPNTLCKEAMTAKEAQMAALGARLLVNAAGVKTATQVQSEDSTAHSVLSTCCDNTSAAYLKALGWYANFANAGGGKIEFMLNTEFVVQSVDAPTLIAMLQLVQAGKLPESDFWAQLRNIGYIDAKKTDDEIREEISSQEPQGGDLFNLPDPDPAAAGKPTGAASTA